MKRSLFIISLLVCFLSIQAKGKYAFIVGVSEYPKYSTVGLQWNNIHGANDASVISGTLKKQGFKVASLVNKNATAAKIKSGFVKFTKQLKAGDIVYIHFSGHGQPYDDLSGDEPDGWDEAIVPYDAGAKYVKGKYEGRNHITDDELNGYITAIRKRVGTTGVVYVILDACHMGDSSRGEEEEEGEVYTRGSMIGFTARNKAYTPRIDARANIQVPSGKGLAKVCYLEACRSYQTNCEIKQNGQYYGPLSYYVNKVLSSESLTANTSWIDKVKKSMNADRRLSNQNIVIETSK